MPNPKQYSRPEALCGGQSPVCLFERSAKADALRAYQRSIGASGEAARAAEEIGNRARRRMGQELAGAELSKGGRPKETGHHEEPVSKPTLAEIGITKRQSSTFQALAAIPEDTYEAAIEAHKKVNAPITTASIGPGYLPRARPGQIPKIFSGGERSVAPKSQFVRPNAPQPKRSPVRSRAREQPIFRDDDEADPSMRAVIDHLGTSLQSCGITHNESAVSPQARPHEIRAPLGRGSKSQFVQ